MRVKTDPVFGRLIIGVSDAVVLGFQFVDPFRLALERNDLKIIEIEKTEHMSADIENKHSFTVLEHGKGQFLFYICAQRKAEIPNLFYVHDYSLPFGMITSFVISVTNLILRAKVQKKSEICKKIRTKLVYLRKK